MPGVKGRSGRKRKPNAMHILNGNPSMLTELPPEIKLPQAESEWDAPEWLGEHGRDEWNRVCPMLRACKVLSEGDLNTLAMYCAVVDELIQSQYDKQPLKGTLLAQFRSFAAELGLTPASRSKIAPIKAEAGSDDAFFAIG